MRTRKGKKQDPIIMQDLQHFSKEIEVKVVFLLILISEQKLFTEPAFKSNILSLEAIQFSR